MYIHIHMYAYIYIDIDICKGRHPQQAPHFRAARLYASAPRDPEISSELLGDLWSFT